MKKLPVLIAILILTALAAVDLAADVSVRLLPESPLLVESRDGYSVQCDFVIRNDSEAEVTIDTIEVSVFDAKNALLMRRFISGNGMPGAIQTLPVRKIAPGAELLLFNPLHTYDRSLPISTLRFRFLFNEGEAWRSRSADVTVKPQAYRGRTELVLPLTGRLLVHDGYDFFSHHRRLDITHPFTRKIGVTGVSGRYAYDFVVVDDEGRMYSGKGTKPEEWFGWDAPVRATGAGVVVASENAIPDNTFGEGDPGHAGPESLMRPDAAVTLERPWSLAGNYILIDHGNGEFSMIAHLKQGSLTVATGDRVRAGQVVGKMGLSGDTMLPHVHYQLQSGADMFRSEGLPSRFSSINRALGSRLVPSNGIIDSGDIVVAKK